MKAVLVARVSSFRQAGNVSAEVQLQACRDYVDSQAGQVVADFFDSVPGTEGRYEERRGLHEALSLIASKDADTLVVYDVSRAARDDVVFSRLLKETYEYGGRLAIAVERQVYKSKSEAEVLLHWTKAASVYELITLKRRTQTAKRQALENGGFIWKPLFGYKTVRKDRIKVLEPDAVLVPIIQEIYSRLLENQNKTDIAKWLHTLNLDFDVRKITKLVNDVGIYAGEARDFTIKLEGEEITKSVTYPAIITAETAFKIRALPKTNYRKDKRPTPYLGVLSCLHCGSGIRIARVYDGKVQLGCKSYANRNYHIGKGRVAPEACSHSVSEIYITKAVLESIDGHIRDLRETVEAFGNKIDELYPLQDSKKLEEIRGQKQNILNRLLDVKDLKAAAKALNDELEKLDEEESRLEKENKELIAIRERFIAQKNTYAEIDWEELKSGLLNNINNRNWKEVNKDLTLIGIQVYGDFSKPGVRASLAVGVMLD